MLINKLMSLPCIVGVTTLRLADKKHRFPTIKDRIIKIIIPASMSISDHYGTSFRRQFYIIDVLDLF